MAVAGCGRMGTSAPTGCVSRKNIVGAGVPTGPQTTTAPIGGASGMPRPTAKRKGYSSAIVRQQGVDGGMKS